MIKKRSNHIPILTNMVVINMPIGLLLTFLNSHAGTAIKYDVSINTVPTNDHRSYHISSEAISRELGFKPKHGIDGAISNVITAFSRRLIPDPMTKPIYYNIEVMKNLNLK